MYMIVYCRYEAVLGRAAKPVSYPAHIAGAVAGWYPWLQTQSDLFLLSPSLNLQILAYKPVVHVLRRTKDKQIKACKGETESKTNIFLTLVTYPLWVAIKRFWCG